MPKRAVDHRSSPSAGRRRGFSFTEILFAVMILGIGFIMIAAIFPATISQTAATVQDTHGANTAKGALEYIQSIASNQTLPPTGGGSGVPAPVVSLQEAAAGQAWKQSRGNYINSQNRRYGWVGLYRRDITDTGLSDYAQVFIIVAQSRNASEFTEIRTAGQTQNGWWNDIEQIDDSKSVNPYSGSKALANLEPRKVRVSVNWDSGNLVGRLQFLSGAAVAAPGAYIIIANDSSSYNGVTGRSTGRIYQLGNPLDNTGTWWELAPGGDMLATDNNVSNVDAYMLGRGFEDMSRGRFTFAGPAMDVAIYTSFVRVNR